MNVETVPSDPPTHVCFGFEDPYHNNRNTQSEKVLNAEHESNKTQNLHTPESVALQRGSIYRFFITSNRTVFPPTLQRGSPSGCMW